MQKTTVIITAWKEPVTIEKTIHSLAKQAKYFSELIVIAPDQETRDSAQKAADEYQLPLKLMTDPQQGKVCALEMAMKEATGKIVICTDGDVIVDEHSVKPLLAPFENEKIGASTAQPISSDPRSTMLGYWSHLLTEYGAHKMRLRRNCAGDFIVVSGYLFACRKMLFPSIPKEILSDDAYVSHKIWEQGYTIAYTPSSKVYVSYPKTYRDWILQKKRSAGGFTQLKRYVKPKNEMRSFWKEVWFGCGCLWSYPKSIKEGIWTIILFAARLHLWALVFWEQRILKKGAKEIWKRVESTK